MRKILDNITYLNDIDKIANINYNWENFRNKTILISGATGMIGSYFIDVVMCLNKKLDLNFKVIAFGRNKERLEDRFYKYLDNKNFEILIGDVNNNIIYDGEINYFIHGASNTHPRAYSTDSIGTISSNIIGTYNLLNLAVGKSCEKFLMLSSVEIYGENVHGLDSFKETDLGYIDCNTLRAGYPESKRLSEALCQAYIQTYDMNIVIPRLSRVYGPTVLNTDSKALSQFIFKSVNNEDIILKSEGNQYFSYTYVGDAISALFLLLLEGVNGEAYNIGDNN